MPAVSLPVNLNQLMVTWGRNLVNAAHKVADYPGKRIMALCSDGLGQTLQSIQNDQVGAASVQVKDQQVRVWSYLATLQSQSI